MKLSIVIPIKNEESLIEKIVSQLQSKLKSLSYEIIFINDFSTDSTTKIYLHIDKFYSSYLSFSDSVICHE